MIFNTHLKYIGSFSVLTVISTFFQNIIPRELESNIWRNNAYKISYIRKKGKWILLKGDGMVTEWHWMVTEWSLKCTCHYVDWMVTERWLNGAFQFSRNGGVSTCEHSCPTIVYQNIYILSKMIFLGFSLYITKHLSLKIKQCGHWS